MIQVADTQNYTGAYVIIDCLQVLVNNLLVWQSKSKLRPAACQCSETKISRCFS